MATKKRKVSQAFAKAAAAHKKAAKSQSPLWKGPEEDGITQSLLNRFLMCRERFRLHVIEGWQEADHFNHYIEYGNMWHICEEALAAHPKSWDFGSLKAYCVKLCKKYPLEQTQVQKWYDICKIAFPIYVKHWEKHPDVKERTPLLQEVSFNVPYTLPSGRVVSLRGKWDSVDLIGSKRNSRVYLQENKTKGQIIEEQLKKQLGFDLQTGIYLVALDEQIATDTAETSLLFGVMAPAGVCYNVIRRPLSGGKGSIRPKKATKNQPAETMEHYYGRLGEIIAENKSEFFMRWKVEITREDIKRFKREFLDPCLEALCVWWEWIEMAPYDPFRQGNTVHWRTPYGIYNIIAEGGKTTMDEFFATGSTLGLERATTLFSELEED